MKKNMKNIVALFLVSIMVMAAVGCGKATLQGNWSGTSSDGTEVTFEFNQDGNGNYNMGGIALSTTYKTEGDQLTVTTSFLGQQKDTVYTYTIKGSTLTLNTSGGETITLKKDK
ncbi:MAG: DUF5640 domain-containing protein [Lachnospira sp.]|nr:DUF5640 domain-containing protein [Lachnospira sp.]